MDSDTETRSRLISPLEARADSAGNGRPILPARSSSRFAEVPPAAAPAPALETKLERRPDLPFKEDSRLIVGRDIRLKGEISDCQVLTVEGHVEAAFSGRLIEVAQTGVFQGTAAVETAEIHGRVQGELTTTKLLRIHSTGKVSGKIRYTRLETLAGGEISGDVTVAGEEGGELGIKLTEARFEQR